MSLYEHPQFNISSRPKKRFKKKDLRLFVSIILISSVFGFLAGSVSGIYFYFQVKNYLEGLNVYSPVISGEEGEGYIAQNPQEKAIIKIIEETSPAVVSVVISKDVPIFEQYFQDPFKEFEDFLGPTPFEQMIPQYRQKGTEKQEIGSGTGVIVSQDGTILTNKHVVLDEKAEYTVFTNDGRKFLAKVLARDPVQDLAVIKIEQEETTDENGESILEPFPVVKLGNSDNLQMGQTVIAIGNALGEFKNTVSVGVVSGLGRTITASGGNFVETLEDVIQTDAAINRGNSGGPLLNLKGEVIGINTAMVSNAQSIGFAIPVNKAKRDIEQVKTIGKIVYPFLGVTYLLVNERVKEENNLSVDYGALIIGEQGQSAVWEDSAAEKAGLKEEDIILELDGEKITQDNSLGKLIMRHNPGDKITLKYLRKGKEKIVEVELGERTE